MREEMATRRLMEFAGHAQVYGLAFADTAITQWKHAILRHSQPRRRVTTRQLSVRDIQHQPAVTGLNQNSHFSHIQKNTQCRFTNSVSLLCS